MSGTARMQKPEECIFAVQSEKIGCGEEKILKEKSAAAEKGIFSKLFPVEKPSIYEAFGDFENKMKKS